MQRAVELIALLKNWIVRERLKEIRHLTRNCLPSGNLQLSEICRLWNSSLIFFIMGKRTQKISDLQRFSQRFLLNNMRTKMKGG